MRTTPLLLVALCGCAGVYGEVAMTRLSGTVEAGGVDVDVKTTALGINAGVEFGNDDRRLSAGYSHEKQSYDQGDGSFDGATVRYDFNVSNLSERMKLRIALGLDAGKEGADEKVSVTGLLGGLTATVVLPWDSYLHVMVGGAYRSATGDTSKGFTARIAVSHRFGVDHSDRDNAARDRKEWNDPLLTKLQTDSTLPAEEIYSTLQQICTGGNRWGCLLASINKAQRDGDRTALGKVAEALTHAVDTSDSMLWHLAYVANKCSTDDDWPACQELKTLLLTQYPWAKASGESFAKVFPGSTPPDEFPMSALEKVQPGKGWYCFHYSGVVQTIVSSDSGPVNVEAGNLGCQRTQDACLQMLETNRANPNITVVGSCVALDTYLWLYDDQMTYQDEKLCKDQAKLKSADTECIPVGNFSTPGL